MSEYDHEPTRGLPAELPEDEHIIWQSAPDWKSLAKGALHIRLTVFYFVAIVLWAIMRGDTKHGGRGVGARDGRGQFVYAICLGRWPNDRVYPDQQAHRFACWRCSQQVHQLAFVPKLSPQSQDAARRTREYRSVAKGHAAFGLPDAVAPCAVDALCSAATYVARHSRRTQCGVAPVQGNPESSTRSTCRSPSGA
jgi:hypothetical protein